MISELNFALREGASSARRGVLLSLLSVATLTLAVIVIVFFYYARLNLQRGALGLLDQMQFEAFIALSLDDDRHLDLQRQLQQLDRRWRIAYVSRDEAAAKFSREFDPTVFDLLKENPLPASFLISLPVSALHPDSARWVADRIRRLEGIEDVVYDGELLRLLSLVRRSLTQWGLILGIAALLIALALTCHAMRLKIDHQGEALRVMSLLGATPRTLRGIYWVQGVFLGAFAGFLSWICLTVLAAQIRVGFADSLYLVMPQPLLTILVGMCIGLLGSAPAAGKYLKA